MAFAVGERMSAARVNNLQPVWQQATGSSNLALSGTLTDITGATITYTTLTDGATYLASANFAYDITSASTSYAEGALLVAGVAQSGKARWSGEVGTDYGMATQQWSGTIATAASTTWKLQANMSSGTDITVLAAYTKLTVIVFEVV